MCVLTSTSVYILTTNLAACVCVCAKVDQFLPARSDFESKRSENFVRIAKFPYAAFGPLFAFHCPLFFTRNNYLGWKSSRFAAVIRRAVVDKQLSQSVQPAWLIAKRSARKRSRPYTAECSDRGSNPVQGTRFFFIFIVCVIFIYFCVILLFFFIFRLTFNKS